MAFQPLSQRNKPNPEFDGPHDGIPAWMYQSVEMWLEGVMFVRGVSRRTPSTPLLLEVEQSLHISLNWAQGEHSAFNSLLARIRSDDDAGLDLLDFLLAHRHLTEEAAASLNAILTKAGSAWEVVHSPPPRKFELTRRTVGPAREAIDAVLSESQRAHAHLMAAWSKLMGRNPDPSSAYREAIRAVEAVAAPVVTPNDTLATLGKIIGTLRANPSGWTVDLAEARPEQVADMAAMIWQSQFDRHGTHDESVPLNVSQEQADAAVHIAIALTRLFAGGHIAAV